MVLRSILIASHGKHIFYGSKVCIEEPQLVKYNSEPTTTACLMIILQ